MKGPAAAGCATHQAASFLFAFCLERSVEQGQLWTGHLIYGMFMFNFNITGRMYQSELN